MSLSSDLMSQFAKITKDEKKSKSETVVYGTAKKVDGTTYVQLDGADILTPASSTTSVKDGERVTVMIKNHTAVITGNISNPAARSSDIEDIAEAASKITEVEILLADKVSTDEFDAQVGRIDQLVSENTVITGRLTASESEIGEMKADYLEVDEELKAHNAAIESLETDKLDAQAASITYATIEELKTTNLNVHNLSGDYAEFESTTTERLDAIDVKIKDLNVENLDSTYANIDFSNITEAAIEKIFADSGIINDLVVENGKITGKLVGVTINGDLIEGNTVKADKLVVLGSDGLYYKLNVDALGETTASSDEKYQNGLDGSVIIAKSITADRVDVSDLVAFDATIGGFKITENSIHSGVKDSIDNTTSGLYLDDEGQMNLGDASNFLKYYVEDGEYKLEISASNIKIGTTDVETKMSLTSDDAEKAIETADTNSARLQSLESTVSVLSSIISALVTGPNGETLMSQTDSGWVFNFASEVNSSIDSINNNIVDLEESTGLTQEQINLLQKADIDLAAYQEYIRFGTNDDGEPYILLGETDSLYKVKITNKSIDFIDGSEILAATIVSDDADASCMKIDRVKVGNELQQGDFVWQTHNDGKNYGLRWKGV